MSNMIIGDEPHYFDHMLYPIMKTVFQPVIDTAQVNYFLFYFLFIKISNYYLAYFNIKKNNVK
jgi:hypothetical protein